MTEELDGPCENCGAADGPPSHDYKTRVCCPECQHRPFNRITIADCIAFAKVYKYGQFAHVYEAKYRASLVEVTK